MSDNLETNNIEQPVTLEATVSAPVNSVSATPEPVLPPNSVPERNPGLTSFTPDEVSPASISSSVISKTVNPIENLAKKEMVTRPLLWGVVVFLVFFALVIGGVSVYRYYQDKNNSKQESSVLSITPITPNTTTQNPLDTTPVSTDTKVQADAISVEVQSIDTDIDGDALSDSSLGL